MAVRVLFELFKSYPEAELCMVGLDQDGSMKSCKKLAEKLGVSNNILFTGQLTKEEWIESSKHLSIFINTTNIESFGLSVMEAAACGLPIITTNVGELIYIYEHKHDALLVEKNDIKAMARSIQNLLNDNKFAESLSVNAREKVEKYSWEFIGKSWKNIIVTLRK